MRGFEHNSRTERGRAGRAAATRRWNICGGAGEPAGAQGNHPLGEPEFPCHFWPLDVEKDQIRLAPVSIGIRRAGILAGPSSNLQTNGAPMNRSVIAAASLFIASGVAGRLQAQTPVSFG